MEPNQKTNSFYKAAEVSILEAARVRAGFELARFVDFIRLNTDADETAATTAAAICLHSLPTCFSDSPQAMEELKAIVKRLDET